MSNAIMDISSAAVPAHLQNRVGKQSAVKVLNCVNDGFLRCLVCFEQIDPQLNTREQSPNGSPLHASAHHTALNLDRATVQRRGFFWVATG